VKIEKEPSNIIIMLQKFPKRSFYFTS